jgi:hypothetical protein
VIRPLEQILERPLGSFDLGPGSMCRFEPLDALEQLVAS